MFERRDFLVFTDSFISSRLKKYCQRTSQEVFPSWQVLFTDNSISLSIKKSTFLKFFIFYP
nr:MAG TPA: hypothetical protein [Caudoviricetes sp.]